MSDDKAFEYVVGTLRGGERKDFEYACQTNAELQLKVHYWEEKLMGLDSSKEQLAPLSHTWNSIEKSITKPARIPSKASRLSLWFLGYVLSSIVIFAGGLFYFLQPALPQDQYIAVMTNPEGGAALTALTVSEEKTMWLQWESTEIPKESSGQLWAVSKRDGIARSIAVFSSNAPSSLDLDTAQWRLVTDADYLLLTEEELGGSAIDEPSDRILAKGVCVRYQNSGKS